MDAKLKVAGLLGAAALAIPGAGLITNAVAADTSSPATTEQQAPAFEPTQSEGRQERQAPDQTRPDREDCPEKDGQGGASGGADGASGTAL